ncbi:lactonase family protein [Cyclobacterium jeungdonense]|uniref:Lactonase family protein n=1 Tax=Cyclobacterium jeungdonense TaxID=708087 RepID=A0ABT8C0Q9_9BACT|nr:lactonase family protein [Cyclobacterium jeungdonense]MDN3686380.1 lactonase family protein [Cyclobacterium jeungdonense]
MNKLVFASVFPNYISRMILLIIIGIITLHFTPKTMAQSAKEILYIGTYSQNDSKGIYVLDFDRTNLSATILQTVHDKQNPTFLALHPSGRYLYAAYREGNNPEDPNGTIVSYSIDQNSGHLSLINQASSAGASPCHISVDPTGQVVFVSHYQGGNLSTFKVADSGAISEPVSVIQHEGSSVHPNQTKPHMHSMIPSSDGKWVYASDLGIDQILKYEVNLKNASVQKDPEIFPVKAGSGPRHFVIHPELPYAYSVEELSNTVGIYTVDPKNGDLLLLDRIEMLSPEIQTDYNAAADIHLSVDGKWLYASNRGQDNLAIYQVDQETGLLKIQGHVPTGGQHPRNFKMDKKGELLLVANMESDNIVIFRIQDQTGIPLPTGKSISIPRAVFIEQLFLK